jgi:hypothetical protein
VKQQLPGTAVQTIGNSPNSSKIKKGSSLNSCYINRITGEIKARGRYSIAVQTAEIPQIVQNPIEQQLEQQ